MRTPVKLTIATLVLLVGVAGPVTGGTQDRPTASVEVRVWQDVGAELQIYISARPASGSWRTLGTIPLPLNDGLSSTGRFRFGDIALDVPMPGVMEPATVEVRVWQDVANIRSIYISARPASGSWRTLGTIALPLDDGLSSTGRFRYGDISLDVALPENLPPERPANPHIKWLFADGISPLRQSEVRQEMADIVTFVGDRFGASASGFTISVGDDDPGRAEHGFMATTDTFWEAAHEYFHVIQAELADGRFWGPLWLVEGSATYAEEAYDGDLEFRRAIAPAAASHVASIRETESADRVRLNYHLGYLAADWLVGHAGEGSLLRYYRLLPDHDGWEGAFEAAFGLTTEEFYEQFERHRTRVAPPLPHVTDDAVTPVAVFIGKVPDHIRSRIQAEMDKVHAFLIERFEAERTEYSVYVAADWESVAEHHRRLSMNLWWDDRVRSHSLPLPWAPSCSSGATGWVVHVTSCVESPGHSVYVNSHLRLLLEDKEQLDLPPLWMEAGGGAYVALAYAATAAATLDSALARHRDVVERSTVPLAQLATTDGWETAAEAERVALSIVAVDWLLGRAGELALFDYFRLLPEGTPGLPSLVVTAASAFDQAFGITLGDFYKQFDVYRSNLAAE